MPLRRSGFFQRMRILSDASAPLQQVSQTPTSHHAPATSPSNPHHASSCNGSNINFSDIIVTSTLSMSQASAPASARRSSASRRRRRISEARRRRRRRLASVSCGRNRMSRLCWTIIARWNWTLSSVWMSSTRIRQSTSGAFTNIFIDAHIEHEFGFCFQLISSIFVDSIKELFIHSLAHCALTGFASPPREQRHCRARELRPLQGQRCARF